MFIRFHPFATKFAIILMAVGSFADADENGPEGALGVERTSIQPEHIVEEVCDECLGTGPQHPRFRHGWSDNSTFAAWVDDTSWLIQWTEYTPLGMLHGQTHAARHQGLGEPLDRASWLNEPTHASAGFGSIWGGSLTDGTESESALLGVVRAGKDGSHYTGWEARFAFAAPEVSDAGGLLATGTTGEIYLADVNAICYPWGDSKWRPFTTLGLGLAYYQYPTIAGDRISDTLFSVPIGIGIKHRHNSRLALRAEIVDYLTFGGSNMDFRNSLTAGASLEWRFGGRRPSYWPWNPGSH